MPKFPKKKLFNTDKVINERRISLTEYLNLMSKQVLILDDEYLCNFFKIENSTREYLGGNIDSHGRG